MHNSSSNEHVQWRQQPNDIVIAPKGTKYVLFIDESGKSKYKGTSEHDHLFTLCGCLMTVEELIAAQQQIQQLKYTYWEDGSFQYKKGHLRVVFHMSEIAKARKGYNDRNNPFCLLGGRLDDFYSEYKAVMQQLEYTVFSVTVDKQEMLRRYSTPYDPYEYALDLLWERVHHCLSRRFRAADQSTVVILESIGRKEDALNHSSIMRLIQHGTDYNSSADFSWIKGVYFCPKHTTEGKSYFGFEMADFCAYPVKMHFVKEKDDADEEFSIIKDKIYKGSGFVSSYGLKKVP